MIRNRTNSLKPTDSLLKNFRTTFLHLTQTSRSQPLRDLPGPTLIDALDLTQHNARGRSGDYEDTKSKNHDQTPRGNKEPGKFIPSLLNSNSSAFNSFANQPPGYCIPTPSSTNTLLHSQADNLHTPNFSFGSESSLSLPTSEDHVHDGQPTSMDRPHGFHPQAFGTHHQSQNQNLFALQSQYTQSSSLQSFTHRHSALEHAPLAQSHEKSLVDSVMSDVEMQEELPIVSCTSHQAFKENIQLTLSRPPSQNFRYQVTLNAATAMMKHTDEIPVTYLNKGQEYSISLVDTALNQSTTVPVKYRTSIRISFEDELQRQRPDAAWQLWKEGRGTNEVHQRGGRLQAIEFVDPSRVSGDQVQGRPRVALDSYSFDCFAVTWMPVHNITPECSISVRFNFLSTDFSHSKGVKGMPVRLCAKTKLLTTVPGSPLEDSKAELCYCKIKLFRDHGAERKISNDITHVNKKIDRLKQEIGQAESGVHGFGKRKRDGSISKATCSTKPAKAPKHKETQSMPSIALSSGPPLPVQEDFHVKLAKLQDMLSLTKPVSTLDLKGEEYDDPDLHPMHIFGTPQDLCRINMNVNATMWERPSSSTKATSSSIMSLTPSSKSLYSGGRQDSSSEQPVLFQSRFRMFSNEWRNLPQTMGGDLKPSEGGLKPLEGFIAGSDIPTKIQRPYNHDHTLSGWIEALDVDQTYQPPPEPMLKPVACFFVRCRIAGKMHDSAYFRAVYLMKRTVKALISGIAMKFRIDPAEVARTIHINWKGHRVLMDDSSIQEIPEQQDMTAEFHEITPLQQLLKHERDTGSTDMQTDQNLGVTESVISMELRLFF